jgi:hypothetical protein
LQDAVDAACALAMQAGEQAAASAASRAFAQQDQGAAQRMAAALISLISPTAAR